MKDFVNIIEAFTRDIIFTPQMGPRAQAVCFPRCNAGNGLDGGVKALTECFVKYVAQSILWFRA